MAKFHEEVGQITVPETQENVSFIKVLPTSPEFFFLLAHGAGAPITHPHLLNIAESLAIINVATFRFNFPYMEKKKRRIDSKAVLFSTIGAALGQAEKSAAGIPIFAGGHSFGGRMISNYARNADLTAIKGIVFYSFPLHPAGKVSADRADHLHNVMQPLLFLSGTRDKLADMDLLKRTCVQLGEKAHLYLIEGADHSFKTLRKQKNTTQDIYKETSHVVLKWMTDHC